MHSASIAEWMVARFTSANRAASIVGDLLELKPQKGPLWFWLSTARVVFSHAWRRSLAYVAASLVGIMVFGGMQATDALGVRRLLSRQYPWMNLFWVLSSIVLFVLAYTAIRYGLRDRLAQLALAMTGLIAAVIRYQYYGRQTPVLMLCITLAASVVVASLLKSERRRAALVLLGVEAVGILGGLLAAHLFNQYLNFAFPMPREAVHGIIQAPPSVAWMYLCMFLATVWIMVTACSRMHNWLLRKKPLDLDTKGGQV
jgi:hypothetical protein